MSKLYANIFDGKYHYIIQLYSKLKIPCEVSGFW